MILQGNENRLSVDFSAFRSGDLDTFNPFSLPEPTESPFHDQVSHLLCIVPHSERYALQGVNDKLM